MTNFVKMTPEQFVTFLEIPKNIVKKVYSDPKLELQNGYYFFTGKGLRTSTIHLGHFFIYSLLAKLSQKANVFFQIANDQKRDQFPNFITYDRAKENTTKFLDNITRFNWDSRNTIFFDNLGEDRLLLDNIAQYLSCYMSVKTLKSIFGYDKPYEHYYALLQCAPILALKYRKQVPVIITAEDEVGYFLILRDVAKRLNLIKPVVIVLEPIKDVLLKEKMSCSVPKGRVAVSPEGFQTLKKSISSPSFYQEDFCMSYLLKLKEVCPELDLARYYEYWSKKESYKLKEMFWTQVVKPFFTTPPKTVKYGLKNFLKEDLKTEDLAEIEKKYLN